MKNYNIYVSSKATYEHYVANNACIESPEE